jgi:hypothetical protein
MTSHSHRPQVNSQYGNGTHGQEEVEKTIDDFLKGKIDLC